MTLGWKCLCQFLILPCVYMLESGIYTDISSSYSLQVCNEWGDHMQMHVAMFTTQANLQLRYRMGNEHERMHMTIATA